MIEALLHVEQVRRSTNEPPQIRELCGEVEVIAREFRACFEWFHGRIKNQLNPCSQGGEAGWDLSLHGYTAREI